MSFQFIIIALVIRYMRTSLKTSITMPEWDRKLLIAMYVSIGLFLASAASDALSFLFDIISYIMIGYLLYLITEQEKFKQFKFLVSALLPYLIVSIISDLIKLISKSFYNEHSGIFESANTFTILWGLGVWLVTRKQQSELTKARARALEEEENTRVITAVKAQLEVQVAERTAELTKQKEELELTVNELKSTQAQLIQSEKMASLGELTAGIAHEIQNPLNFVNNFSDVNNELIDEMLHEINNSNPEEAKHIAQDIKDNNGKIIFHGKRADSIVKGMLQHSRKNTGVKEPTDINALCDEYLRLSYHGLRAKDKSFNADFKADFDESIDKINTVSQDIGRVLLNLFNNAFYTVNEKKKTAGETFKPLVCVQTKRISGNNDINQNSSSEDGVEINISDNGNGIPQNIVDKIFQPFFTTKPTGQGTGLGLSLAYDIITKVHNGSIKVESKEGEGTTFIINIPAK